MAKEPTPAPAPFVTPDKLPVAKATTGNVISLASNLPHGLHIIHAGKTLQVNGGNHPKAIQTSLAHSGKWGITHDVDEEWFDDWAATGHPAVVNGLIVKNAKGKIEDHAEALGDAISNGVDGVDPDAPADNVEQRKDDE